MRLDLPDGQHAILREKLTYAQARELRLAYFNAQKDVAAQADYDLTVIRVMVSAWHVLDFDGQAVSLDQPQQAPDSIIQAIFTAGVDLLPEAMGVPKAGGEISPTSPAESQSSPMNGSAQSSSLPTIPDGLTPI